MKLIMAKVCLLALAASCTSASPTQTTETQNASVSVPITATGKVPADLPAHMLVGLFEQNPATWMQNSGVPWDVRYAYFTYGWANNWGYGAHDGSWGKAFFDTSAAGGFTPAVEYYVMNNEPGGGEPQFLAKMQTASTMAEYFGDFKILMQQIKAFGKPVVVLLEADGFGFVEQQSGGNPNAYAAVKDSGVAELAALPNTVAGWGMAFLALRNAVGATNAVLGVHVSSWASGNEIAYNDVTIPLQPEVDTVYSFLSPLGLAPNATGSTFDLLVGDPLDRDSDFYKVVLGETRAWDPGDTASVSSASFNRYRTWLGLWNVKASRRWVLWQIPLGNSNHLDVCNNGAARQGYRDNRAEYFFGAESAAHLASFANAGVVGLLFGVGASCQSSYENDIYTDGKPFMQTHVGAFYASGGLALSSKAASFGASATVSPATAGVSQPVNVQVSVTDTGTALANAIVDVEVYDSAANKVGQTFWSDKTFAAGETQSYSYVWTPLSTGTYSVAVGVFSAGWATDYLWSSNTATIDVTTDPSRYGFETGTDGWTSTAATTSTTAEAYAGTHALGVTVQGSVTETVSVLSPATPVGASVTFHVWVPTGTQLVSVQPFVQQGAGGGWAWTGTWEPVASLTPGGWNTLVVSVPGTATVPLYQLGVQLTRAGSGSETVYIDAVNW